MRVSLATVALLGALAFAPAALASPPANDNRDAAAAIPTFPATIAGTTAEATVERLDPQISECGRIEGTLWYRIDQAPDGTVGLSVQSTEIAPVIRVYALAKSGITERACAAAAVGSTAQVAFGTRRGASYLVLVGHKPSTPDGAFELDARLYLPPLNDTRSEAAPVGKLSSSVSGTTLGATTDTNDPRGCGLAAGTVWYTVAPGAASRLVLRLHATGELDAAVAVVRHVRSSFDTVACTSTDAHGDAGLAWDVQSGAAYLVAVGQRGDSLPGDFTLGVSAAPALETAPGAQLAAGGAGSTVDALTDPNDVYWASLVAGRTYRVAFRSPGCAALTLRSKHREVLRLRCSDYATFTPGPDGGGRYILEVLAPGRSTSTTYRLQLAPVAPDDVGVGLELPNLTTAHGSLAPAGVDVADVFHFDVSTPSDVRLRLGKAARRAFSVTLATDSGGRIATSDRQIRLQLRPGHYVAAVRGAIGTPSGRYSLGLVVRQLTKTTLTASAREIAPGGSVTFSLSATPQPDAGVLELEIDRLDPFGGWQFVRLEKVRVPAGTVTWVPPAPGRWRARVRFLGTLRFSPSESGYVQLLVAKPLR